MSLNSQIFNPDTDGAGAGSGLANGATDILFQLSGKPRRITLYCACDQSHSILVQIFNPADEKWTTVKVVNSASKVKSDATQPDTAADDSTYINVSELQDYMLPSKSRGLILNNSGAAAAAYRVDCHITDALDRGL